MSHAIDGFDKMKTELTFGCDIWNSITSTSFARNKAKLSFKGNHLIYVDDTTLMAESEEELKSL